MWPAIAARVLRDIDDKAAAAQAQLPERQARDATLVYLLEAALLPHMAPLLRLCGERLAPGGVILFSNNLRRFRLDESLHEAFEVRSTTPQGIPFDFERNPRIHVSYELRRRSEILSKI